MFLVIDPKHFRFKKSEYDYKSLLLGRTRTCDSSSIPSQQQMVICFELLSIQKDADFLLGQRKVCAVLTAGNEEKPVFGVNQY